MSEAYQQVSSIKPEVDTTVAVESVVPPSRVVVLADLNVNPPETEDNDSLILLPAPDITRFLPFHFLPSLQFILCFILYYEQK